MSHAYTPGLRVSDAVVVRRERRLPLRGEVLVERGAAVEPGTIVARTELPGNVQTVNLAGQLSLEPARAIEALSHPIGTRVARGDVIASARGLFGLVQTKVAAPADGVIESVSSITGQLLLREPPIPVEVAAYVGGTVAEVLPGEGVIIEARGALVQGIFGVGGETFGPLEVRCGPDDDWSPAMLQGDVRGKVLAGGAHIDHATLCEARDAGAVALIVGGFDDRDLRELLGRDLGVAITGSEELGITLVLTEGFGRIPMAERTWSLLQRQAGRQASVSGATQIRAGVIRPEILVPHALAAGGPEADDGGALAVGATVRVIRPPYFGLIGRVIELPSELRALETEARVRVLVVEFPDGGGTAVVPRANVERIAP